MTTRKDLRRSLFEVLETRDLMATVPAPVERWIGHEYLPDQLIVKFAEGAGEAERAQVLGQLGASTTEYWDDLRIAVVSLPHTDGVDPVVPSAQWLHTQAAVEYAEPNFLAGEAQRVPNDPGYFLEWGLANTGQVGIADTGFPVNVAGTPGADIDAQLAWDISTGGSETVVAVIDTGVDYFHPDLRANIWRNPGENFDGIDNDNNGYVDDVYGYDFVGRDSDPSDLDGHGTHLAGTIAAVGNNGIGVTGVSWNSKIMILKAYGVEGGSASTFIAAIRYSGMMRKNFGINVVASNNSWGIYNYFPNFSASFYDAIKYASDAGVSFVAASGNDTLNLDETDLFDTPSEIPDGGVIGVASSNRLDQLSDFSNWGPSVVDIAAPGTDILATWPTALRADCLAATQSTATYPNGYCMISGTSMAAPMVAGAIAVLRSLAPNLTTAETKAILLNSVDKLPAFEDRLVSEGRMNLYKAVLALPHVTVNGTVFNDRNGNASRGPNEGPLTGFRVYIDANNNGLFEPTEISTLTDATGSYTLNIYNSAGPNTVRVVAPAGWRQTLPVGGGGYTVNVANGQTVNLTFGLRELPGGILGRKWNDLNGDGAGDPATEPGVKGITIYVDLNNNGKLESAEPRAVTDDQGSYVIGNLAPGTYTLREVGIPGWLPTGLDPAGPAAVSSVVVTPNANTANVDFFNQAAVDYGDAPAPYAVTSAEGGPFAPILAGFHLGLSVDGEADGVHSAAGLADVDDNTGVDDEDGLVIDPIFPSQPINATLTVRTGGQGGGLLQLWFDYNGDGVFAEDERIVRNLQVGNVTNVPLFGANGITGTTPIAPANINLLNPIFARARYGFEKDLAPTGGQYAGEVEDYRLDVLSVTPIARDDSGYVARVGSLFAQNPLNNPNVTANDTRGIGGGPFLVNPESLENGGATARGGLVRINNNGTPLVPGDDYLEYQAPTSVTPGNLVDTFRYRVADSFPVTGATQFSNYATVTIQLVPAEIVAVDNTFTFMVGAPTTNSMDVLANDISFRAMTITQVTVVPPPVGFASVGTVTISGDGRTLVFAENGNNGLNQFIYTVTDDINDPSRAKTAMVTVQVNSVANQGDNTSSRPLLQAELQVVPTDNDGNPLTEVVPGQSFWATVYTRDPRPGAAFPGVRAAYVDLLYDRTLFTPTSPTYLETDDLGNPILIPALTANGNYRVNHNDFGISGDPDEVPVYNILQEPLLTGPNGDAVGANSILGVVNDAGGFWDGTPASGSETSIRYPNLSGYTPSLGAAKYPLYRFQLTANSNITGSRTTTFDLDPADQPASNPNSVLVISTTTGNPQKLTPQQVNFIAYAGFVVRGPVPLVANPEGEYTNIAFREDVNSDRLVDAADVLSVIYEYGNAKGVSEIWKLQPGMFGRSEPLIGYIDVNGDGELAPDDILHVIYKMRNPGGNGEGESSSKSDEYISIVDSLFTEDDE